MKTTLTGLVAALIVGAIGLIIIRSLGVIQLPSLNRSPSPSASVEPNFELSADPSVAPSSSPATSPSVTPSSSPKASTKGGLVLGEDDESATANTPRTTVTPRTTTTTTTTVTHVNITVAKTSDCPSSITSEIKDITSSLSVQYRIHDGFSANIRVINEKGEELSGRNLYTGNGKIVDTGSAKNIQVIIEPQTCQNVDYDWLHVFASR